MTRVPFEEIPLDYLSPFLLALRCKPDIRVSELRPLFRTFYGEGLTEKHRESILLEQLSYYFFGFEVKQGEPHVEVHTTLAGEVPTL